jgi:hypothetical protein
MIIMTKFIKKITKGVKNVDSCIVIGQAFGNLNELTEIFKTVFILSNGVDSFRKKNVIYRIDFNDVKTLPHISAAFIDEDQLDNITKLDEILRKNKVVIYIGTSEPIPGGHGKFFNKRNYVLVEILKTYQVWKTKI